MSHEDVLLLNSLYTSLISEYDSKPKSSDYTGVSVEKLLKKANLPSNSFFETFFLMLCVDHGIINYSCFVKMVLLLSFLPVNDIITSKNIVNNLDCYLYFFKESSVNSVKLLLYQMPSSNLLELFSDGELPEGFSSILEKDLYKYFKS